MKIAALLVIFAVAVMGASPARADGPLDPGDDKWNVRGPNDTGKMTVQGDRPLDVPPPAPPIPFWVSMPATLVVAAGGFVLVIPQLSIDHVLGYRDGANRELGYIGLGVLTLAPALGLGLSGGGVGTIIMGPLIEAALIGAAFGSAYLANLALHSTSNTIGQIAVDDLVGIPLVTLAVPIIAAAALFPVLCAFVPGSGLDEEDERELRPLDAVGFLPIRGGGIVSVGFKLP